MRQLLPYPDPAPDIWDVYAYPADRAWLRANMVASADGAATHEGRARGLSSDADRRLFRVLRALADVVLVAAGTVRAESYGPPRCPADLVERRVANGRPPEPTIAVVTNSLDLDWTAPLFTAGATRPIVMTSAASDAVRRAAAAEVADLIVAGETSVDPRLALLELAALGHARVLTEGGPSFLGQLVAAGVLDELCLAISPRLAGAGAVRIVDGPAAELAEMRLVALLEDEGFLFTRYARGLTAS